MQHVSGLRVSGALMSAVHVRAAAELSMAYKRYHSASSCAHMRPHALCCGVAWRAGVLLMQLAVPELRPVSNVRLFNAELRQFGNDLEKWRLYKVRSAAQRCPAGAHLHF